MIPWIELLFYIGVIFAPDEALQISFEIENHKYIFTQNTQLQNWYPYEDHSQKWSVKNDTLFVEKQGRKTPHFFQINREQAQKAFENGSTYEINQGFTLSRDISGISVVFDLGSTINNFQIKWTLDDPSS